MRSSNYTFPCGCTFPILESNGKIKIDFEPSAETIRLDCPATWKLIGEGDTKGIFQLETRLGQIWAKELKPENIEQLAALTAILRPGCLEGIVDGKSITKHYCDRKNKKEESKVFHPALESILSPTYNLLIYQEQAMLIASEIAGFTLEESDFLRKAMGKKLPEEMQKLKQKFLDGCKKIGKINQKEAQEIFGWIEKSQRYSFNKSHAVSYAYNGYITAYLKAHFPHLFFEQYLKYAKEKLKPTDEIKYLIENAKQKGVEILPPNIEHLNIDFELINDRIYFGFSNIKGIGEKSILKLKRELKDINFKLISWPEFLVRYGVNVTKTIMERLISVGSMSTFTLSRTEMLYHYRVLQQLTNKEVSWIRTNYSDEPLVVMLKRLSEQNVGKNSPISNKNRLKIIQGQIKNLENPPYNIDRDSPQWIVKVERELLGTPLSFTEAEIYENSKSNCTCIDFLQQKCPTNPILSVRLEEIRYTKTKHGSPMAFMKAADITATIDQILVFQEVLEKSEKWLIKGDVVLVKGYRGKFKESLVATEISPVGNYV